MADAIPQRMKAAVLHGWHDLRYEDFATPQVGPEEVLCRVGACGICGTDVHIMEGRFKGVFPPQFPFILGHEWFGEIAVLGTGVEGFSVGQRVIGEPQKGGPVPLMCERSPSRQRIQTLWAQCQWSLCRVRGRAWNDDPFHA
jgi:threonine dehydrogenase-like Zn-dependent dehydrogenase